MEEQATSVVERPPSARKGTLARVAVEVFSIVLGVLLALAVSEWQEQRNTVQRVDAALLNLRHELDSNRELVKAVHGGNRSIVAALESELDDPEHQDFVPAVQISASAWEALGATGLSNHVDYQLLVELSRLYGLVDIYRQSALGLFDADLTMRAMLTAQGTSFEEQGRGELMASNFLGRFKLLVTMEEALLHMHEQAISSLDAALRGS